MFGTHTYIGKNYVSQKVSFQSLFLNNFFEIDDITEQNIDDQLIIAGVKTNFFSDFKKIKSRITVDYESSEINSSTKLCFNENEMTTEVSLQNVLSFKKKTVFGRSTELFFFKK